ncbi:hypothetical protein IAI10_16150 [Clostridium sp. 19966]|uniref:hypothetical protein n=1 Tax=Clostridium sp. 19966 TaxID=2768166 RepID=UPI0028DEDA26|nr:hypothetical protein [Clostridium sp. 19966]MDT8718199.1 hypothetical protein [Clostridium sp. 19966]
MVRYYIFKIYLILFFMLVIISGAISLSIYNINVLNILSSGSMYNIAGQVIVVANDLKIKYDVSQILHNQNPHLLNINVSYIISTLFFTLGLLQNIGVLTFSNLNNIIICSASTIYLYWQNEKRKRDFLEYRNFKNEYIKENGEDAFNEFEREKNEEVDAMYNKFKNIIEKNNNKEEK